MRILLFAAARQRVGAGSIELELVMPTNIESVRSALIARHPDLQSLVSTSRWAVDQSFVDDGKIIHGHEEVALIPPVSGG